MQDTYSGRGCGHEHGHEEKWVYIAHVVNKVDMACDGSRIYSPVVIESSEDR